MKESQEKSTHNNSSSYQALFNNAEDGMALIDPQTGSLLDVNPFLSRLLGYTNKQLLGKKIWLLSSDDQRSAARDAFQELQEKGYLRRVWMPLQTKSGKIIYVDLICNTYQQGEKKVAQCNIHDVTDQKRFMDDLAKTRDMLREQSIRDHLTGLFNRRYLEDTLEREILRCFRSMSPLGLIMLDVDNFRDYNNNHGHDAGDSVLNKLGSLLNQSVRSADVSARFGGDEFIVIMPNASRRVTLRRAEQIRQKAEMINTTNNGKKLEKISLSIGVAIFPEDGTTSKELLKAADKALYQAKKDEKESIRSFNKKAQETAIVKNSGPRN